MRKFFCTLAVVGTIGVLTASQQTSDRTLARPDFVGTWDLAPEVPGFAAHGNPPDGRLNVGTAPHRLVISQEADKLRIVEHRSTFTVPVNTLEYGLSGQPIKSQFVIEPPRNAMPCEVTSKWVDNKFVSNIKVAVPAEPEPRGYEETLSISPSGILAVRIQRIGAADSRTLFYRKGKQDSE